MSSYSQRTQARAKGVERRITVVLLALLWPPATIGVESTSFDLAAERDERVVGAADGAKHATRWRFRFWVINTGDGGSAPFRMSLNVYSRIGSSAADRRSEWALVGSYTHDSSALQRGDKSECMHAELQLAADSDDAAAGVTWPYRFEFTAEIVGGQTDRNSKNNAVDYVVLRPKESQATFGHGPC